MAEEIKEVETTEEVVEEVAEEVAPVEETVETPVEEAPAAEEVVEETPVAEEAPAAEETKEEVVKEVKTEKKQFNRRDNRNNNNRNNNRRTFEPKKKLLDERVIDLKRVTKVTKGGRHMRSSATMAVGDGKGLVGIGSGKANEAPEAIKKALQAANKNLVKVSLVDGNRTIPHDTFGTCGKSRVMIKPAPKGTGIIAGGAARAILEIAGIKDVVSKSLGSNTKINVAKATLEALKSEKTPEVIAELRGKKVEEL